VRIKDMHERHDLPAELADIDAQLRAARPSVPADALEGARRRARAAAASHRPRRRGSLSAATLAAAVGLAGAGFAVAGANPIGLVDSGGVEQNATATQYEAQRFLIEVGLTVSDLQLQVNLVPCQQFLILVGPLPGLSGACPLVEADIAVLQNAGF